MMMATWRSFEAREPGWRAYYERLLSAIFRRSGPAAERQVWNAAFAKGYAHA
jgi:hypothetical protein